jgi:hypothetical protein
MRNLTARSTTRDIRAVSSLPSWAQSSIIAAGVLLSPVLALLMPLIVAVLLAPLKEAGVAASVAIVATCIVAYLLVRKVRVPVVGRQLGTTEPCRSKAQGL